MFSQIVVGVDGRAGGHDAIMLAQQLLAPEGSLILTHVLAGTGARSAYASLADEEDKLVAEIRTTGLSADIGGEVLCVRSSSPGRGLHEHAERSRADLIVVGSCRRSVLGRVLIGDDTRAALNGAPCAVAIAPAGYANHAAAIRRVGVADDGSPESIHALDTARDLADELEASLSAFATVSLPAEELAIHSASVDLLVVGSRGYAPVSRLIHGSTSRQLARTARCPLLVLARSIDIRDGADDLYTAAAGVEVAQDASAPRRLGLEYVED